MPNHQLRHALLLIVVLVATIVTVWSIEHAPVRAYGAIERQGSGF